MRIATTWSETQEPLRIFISYSHQDEELRRDLVTHLSILKREGLITFWTDISILPGENWKEEISRKLDSSDVVLLLVSPDFAASDYCWDVEMARAVELHDAGSTVVIPVIRLGFHV
jgi:hypothetical protein